jgi:hypothetical protein
MLSSDAWNLRSLVHYFYISGVTEHTVAFPFSEFANNAESLQMLQGLVGGCRGNPRFSDCPAVL